MGTLKLSDADKELIESKRVAAVALRKEVAETKELRSLLSHTIARVVKEEKKTNRLNKERTWMEYGKDQWRLNAEFNDGCDSLIIAETIKVEQLLNDFGDDTPICTVEQRKLEDGFLAMAYVANEKVRFITLEEGREFKVPDSMMETKSIRRSDRSRRVNGSYKC